MVTEVDVFRLDAAQARAIVEAGKQREKEPAKFMTARQALNAALFATLVSRADARSRQSAGLFSARQLEQILSEVEETDLPPNNMLDIFPVGVGVQAGARQFTIQRIDKTGRPKVYQGKGDDIPLVNLNQAETTYNVRAYVLAYEWDLFESLSGDFANRDVVKEGLQGVRDSLLEFANEKTAFGDEDNGITGVFNNPFVNKMSLDVIFSEGSDPLLMLAALNRVVNAPTRLVKGRKDRMPDALMVSDRIDDIISTTPMSADNAMSVKETFLKNNRKIREIIGVWELNDVGGDGVDGLFAFRKDDPKSVVNYIPVQITSLATQEKDYEYRVPSFMTHGGVVMIKPMSNVVAFAAVA